MRRWSFGRLLLWLCLASVISCVVSLGPAFAAPAAPSGAAGGGVSGYAVSNISYTLDERDAHRVAGVSFALSAPATSVRVTLGGRESDCAVQGTQASCSFVAEPTVAALSSLSVAAVS